MRWRVFFEAVPSLKARVALTAAYAAGLRVAEVVCLKVNDIDSGRMVIQIRQGKGGKDRTVMLSNRLLDILRTYWRLTRPVDWLFPGQGDGPIHVSTLHAACRSATKAAGLTKKVSLHTLRHSFATHHQIGTVRAMTSDSTGLSGVFESGSSPGKADAEAEVEKLHATIGRLVVERDFLAKASGR